LRHLPIRARVTLAFAAAMAAVLLAVGLLIYLRFESELNGNLDRSLRASAGDATTLLRESDAEGDALPARDGSFAQMLTPVGRIVDTTARPRSLTVLDRAELRSAAAGSTFLERSGVPGIDDEARLLATPVQANGRQFVIVVGTSLDARDEALASLATLLLIGGPVALLLASVVGYAAIAAAVRPVEAIRRQAAEISAADPEQRLPVPASRDELHRLAETLNQMLGRLEEALERERAFVDDASHELRTPLAMHRAELEVALRYAASTTELRAAIASAIEEADRLSQLAEDLLALARADKGQLAIKLETVDVGSLLGSLRERFSARAHGLGRRLESAPSDGLAVRGDRLRLEQALTNLIDNALRHGGGPIRLWARRSGEAVELHVSDEGEGFPPAFLSGAFERFSRADSARTVGGSGLGLAIVEAIAEAHGGSVGAANRDGAGADVWVELPLADH
jgi:two-component system OmpR family sensor kinase